jgi:hypothetical protein
MGSFTSQNYNQLELISQIFIELRKLSSQKALASINSTTSSGLDMIRHTTRGFPHRMSRDHFVVLPSNSCPNVYPENTAGKFNVSWENPLELDGQGWRVALIEMNYNYSPKTINPTYGVEYSKLTSHMITVGNFTFVWSDAKSSPYLEGDALKDYPPKRPPFDNWKLPHFSIDHDGKIMAECQHRFTISFSSVKHAAKMGFKTHHF